MTYAIEHIASRLKEARERKGLSQRVLGKLAGMPQSHISKIENGSVDLRLSSLIELARVLDMELALVPGHSISVVRSIARSSEPPRQAQAESDRRLFSLLQKTVASTIDAYPDSKENAQLLRVAKDVQHFHLNKDHRDAIRRVVKALNEYLKSRQPEMLSGSLAEIRSLRDELAHSALQIKGKGVVRSVYSLEEDDHG